MATASRTLTLTLIPNPNPNPYQVRGGTFVHLAVNHDRLAAMAQLGREEVLEQHDLWLLSVAKAPLALNPNPNYNPNPNPNPNPKTIQVLRLRSRPPMGSQ